MSKKRFVKKIVKKTARKSVKKKGGGKFEDVLYAVTYLMCPTHKLRYPKGGACPRCNQ